MQTGMHSKSVQKRNVSKQTCTLRGADALKLEAGGRGKGGQYECRHTCTVFQ